jgi:hypothetical protein
MVLHNSDPSVYEFIATCAGQGIFGGYVYGKHNNNIHAKGIALLALHDGNIESATIC